jgi:phosphatidylglycerophosphate synthase
MRLLANMFDGMVAVATGKASRLGELYNEAPDRVSDAATLIGLGYARASIPVLGYVAACAALFTAYVRTLGKSAGAQNEFCGPMAKQQRMFIVTIVAAYLAAAPVAWRSNWWGVPAFALLIVVVGCVLTSLRRLARIARTLRSSAGTGGGTHAA